MSRVPNERTANLPRISPTGLNNFDGSESDFSALTSSFTGLASPFTGEPSPEEAEYYLTNFITLKLKYFPYVYIPSTMTAQQLRQERPFLWLCIMLVTTKSVSLQFVLHNAVRRTVTQEIVFKSEANIDLLLGLLTYLGWWYVLILSQVGLSLTSSL